MDEHKIEEIGEEIEEGDWHNQSSQNKIDLAMIAEEDEIGISDRQSIKSNSARGENPNILEELY